MRVRNGRSRDNQGCLDLIEKKRTGVMSMISEEIYVPQGSDFTMVEKMHTQNYGYNDFYAKPVVRGGRAGSGTQLTPQEGFIIKHYAGSVPYKVNGFLDKCKDRLPADSEELLKNSTNSLIKDFFKDAQGWDDGAHTHLLSPSVISPYKPNVFLCPDSQEWRSAGDPRREVQELDAGSVRDAHRN